ncbi:hypothetical protein ACFQ2M_33625 [Kitasatospora saccharophila]|uniref:hypothetical protein n=1 Tax=Kitasatospora saccharophila TaxID=407973 RepID=UPI0031CE7464
MATARRTALIGSSVAELPSLVAGFGAPALNPGEPWADRVPADLAAAGVPADGQGGRGGARRPGRGVSGLSRW